ncbi:efflux RND transporter permease subunit [Robbsia andropogonis]|uniref:efflux RND transporter permease subunit n=1 Tax=Robbsia andropogonis TaxID=28092 RepID=UPI0009E35643|nr:efflux RND transporter permease subunit [Robbsia andropogonis]
MSRFFIHRPILACVFAIVIMMLGGAAVMTLPVEQYPTIAPPTIKITATYPGASADTVATTVTQVIEQDLSGLDNLLYMSSTSSSAGTSQITLSFKAGTNADVAAMQVQNKVQEANASLPTAVQNQGVQVSKASSSFLMMVSLSSTDGSMNDVDLGNLIATRIEDPLTQISGVGDVKLFGAQHSMRIWLDPRKLRSYGLMTSDVTTAITNQNTQLSLGQIGGTPATSQQVINATITSKGILKSTGDFGNILLRVNTDGSRVYLKDVARIEVGGDSYDTTSRVNGKPAATLAVEMSTGANALNVAKAVKAKMASLQKQLPSSVAIDYPYDTTPFISISVSEVVKTLVEAVVLVFFVMYLFLGSLRATIIPTVVVPVALLGTFGLMSVFGFTINVLSLFAMVLAIGLLVDDAIVVVENVERILREERLSPAKATAKAMGQIGGALVGVTAVLVAVFIPMAFMSGSTGAVYRQFSITITAAMVLSVVLALTLTPALCAALLKPAKDEHHRKGFFAWFDRKFENGSRRYSGWVSGLIARPLRSFLAYGVICVIAGLMYWKLPSSFFPTEDQGFFITAIALPPGSSANQTDVVTRQVEDYYLKTPGVDKIIMLGGFSFNGSGQNNAMAFVRLKDWSERSGKESAQALINAANRHFFGQKAAQIFVMNPPAIQSLGNYSGLDFELEDQAGAGATALAKAREELVAAAAKNPLLGTVRSQGMADQPQYEVDIDYLKAAAMGVTAANINDTLQTAFGSSYVNNYVDTGRIQKVYVQGDAQYRMMPFDIGTWYVMSTASTNSSNATSSTTSSSSSSSSTSSSSSSTSTSSTTNYDSVMVPFSAFATGHWTYGSPQIERYNRVLASEMSAQVPDGVSSGQAMDEIEKLVAKLPQGIGMEWTGESYQESLAGSQAMYLYALSLVVVFLCLAGLYESWSVPISVILVVPLGIVGALAAAHLRGLDDDIYFKVGLLTTVGLATKNAILIVEYAKTLQEQGRGLIESAIEAAHLRLRPILMTSLAFGFGVLPMVLASGAGAASRQALGTGVLGGMIAATVLAVLLVPVFFVVVRRFSGKTVATSHAEQDDEDDSDGTHHDGPENALGENGRREQT